MLVSKRKEAGSKLCFTEIFHKFSANKDEISFKVSDNFHCHDQTSGYLGLTGGSHVASYEPKGEEKVLYVFSAKLDFSAKNRWIMTDMMADFNLASLNPQGAIREVEYTSQGAVIKFSTDQGIDDTKHTYAIPLRGNANFQYIPQQNTTGCMINSYYTQFDINHIEVYSFSEPYIKFDTSSLAVGQNQITVTAFDSTQEETDKETYTFVIEIVENPLAKIELKFDEKVLLPIHATKGSQIIHNFHSSSIVRGNELKFEVVYTSESGKQYLKSNTIESVEYTVDYNRAFEKLGHPIIRSDSAAIVLLQGKEDPSGRQEADDLIIKVFRCNSFSEVSENCYSVSTIDLEKGNFGLLGVKPRTLLGTTIFFLYNYDLDISYMFYTDFDSKKTNYETFNGKLLDANFMHTASGQIIGLYLIEDVGVYASVFYQDWSFGSRRRVLIGSQTVGENSFCPQQIVSRSGFTESFTLLSNCGGVIELIVFGFDYDSRSE